ncbi:MAG: usg protein [Hyphomicrobiales bacterium]|nr:usg protein [Hyphomicrobiales bacterium]MBV9738278.1 usg protein [Hyphomicrobiales bacterium]
MVSKDFLKQLAGFGLTTAEILYRLPDHPIFLQSYIWQDYDVAPRFPLLRDFLAFWREKLDGDLHCVRVAHSKLIKPLELRLIAKEHAIH